MDSETTGPTKLSDPSLLVAVSTSIPQYRALYSQARELANYLLKTLKFEEVAVIHSSAFPPEVMVSEDGTATLPSCRFYVHRGKSDLLLFAGDSSPMEDQYHFTEALLGYAERAGVREVYSVGARWSEIPLPAFQEPRLKGFATDREGVDRLKEHGVEIVEAEPAPFFASMVVGMAGRHRMKVYKIQVDHGDPMPHTRSVIKMLEALSRLIGFEVGLDELRAQVKLPPQERPPGAGQVYQ
jgi:proteasome assembly chaperone (PAC2) family protein